MAKLDTLVIKLDFPWIGRKRRRSNIDEMKKEQQKEGEKKETQPLNIERNRFLLGYNQIK